MSLYKQISQLFIEDSEQKFEDVAIKVFRRQSHLNKVYSHYLDLIGISPRSISDWLDIPLMPIEFFKRYEVKSGNWKAEKIFLSSGTQGSQRSSHHLRDSAWYDRQSVAIAQQSGIDLGQVAVLGLLPSYLENGDSSLVHMVEHFVSKSDTPTPQFFLYNHKELHSRILSLLEETDKDILLIGVTFALLDFAKLYPIASSRLKILFTGGMKNRGEELLGEEIRMQLGAAFGSSEIWSEYGMTEMLSQAYAKDSARYKMPATMRVRPIEINDPLSDYKYGKTARLGVVDLANIDTLSFILTQDLGVVYEDDTFEVIGRMQTSDMRGCTLMYNPQDYS